MVPLKDITAQTKFESFIQNGSSGIEVTLLSIHRKIKTIPSSKLNIYQKSFVPAICHPKPTDFYSFTEPMNIKRASLQNECSKYKTFEVARIQFRIKVVNCEEVNELFSSNLIIIFYNI